MAIGTPIRSMGRLHLLGFLGGLASPIVPTAILCVAAVVILGCFSRPAEAMFVASPEKEEEPPQTEEEIIPAQEAAERHTKGGTEQTSPLPKAAVEPVTPEGSPETTPPEDTKLRKEMSRIVTAESEKRNVNSGAFARMSGETDKLKPVALPVRLLEQRRFLRGRVQQYQDPGDELFSVGSWIFIFLCLAAALVALLKIRRLSSRPA